MRNPIQIYFGDVEECVSEWEGCELIVLGEWAGVDVEPEFARVGYDDIGD